MLGEWQNRHSLMSFLTKLVDRVPRARALWGLDSALVGAGPGRSAPETSKDRPGTGQKL